MITLQKKYRDSELTEKKRRRRPPTSIILHTTGYGVGLERIDKRHRKDEDADEAYANRLDRVLEYKCEFLVGRCGGIYEMTDWSSYFEYHTGSANRKKLKREPPSWWRARYPDVASPLSLPAWKHGSPNSDSVGIDLLAPRVRDKSAFKPLQLESAARLVAYLTTEFGVLITDETVLDHSSVDPIGRGNPKGPWDFPDKVDLGALRERAKVISKEFGADYDLRASIAPEAPA